MVEVFPTSRVFIAAPAPALSIKPSTTSVSTPILHRINTALPSDNPPQQVLYILQQPEVIKEVKQPNTTVVQLPIKPLIQPPLTEVSSPLPLDLSCKVRHDSSSSSFFDLGLGPRTNSCSSSSSSIFSDEEKRQKRKEQNKAAAQTYRQRKKSFSDFIECEHDKMMKKNVELKAQRALLEKQIKNMRALLDRAAKKEKDLERSNAEMQVAETNTEANRRRNPSAMAAISVSMPPPSLPILTPLEIRPRSFSDVSPLMLPQYPSKDVATAMGVEIRERKNTWPHGATAPVAISARGKERKKEQNKMASRRFRQRRKLEMSHCENQSIKLEARNKKLKEIVNEMESKIRLLKDLIQSNGGDEKEKKEDNNAKEQISTNAMIK